mgnify:CR=1 FL=1
MLLKDRSSSEADWVGCSIAEAEEEEEEEEEEEGKGNVRRDNKQRP